MGHDLRPVVCERSREWESRRSDGELSMIENRLLDAHLAHCVECRTFAETLTDVTVVLRSTPLERPTLGFDLAGSRRARRRQRLGSAVQASGVAAAVLVVFGLGVLMPHPSNDQPDRAPVGAVVGTSGPNDGELLRIERAGNPHARIDAVSRSFGVVQ